MWTSPSDVAIDRGILIGYLGGCCARYRRYQYMYQRRGLTHYSHDHIMLESSRKKYPPLCTRINLLYAYVFIIQASFQKPVITIDTKTARVASFINLKLI